MHAELIKVTFKHWDVEICCGLVWCGVLMKAVEPLATQIPHQPASHRGCFFFCLFTTWNTNYSQMGQRWLSPLTCTVNKWRSVTKCHHNIFWLIYKKKNIKPHQNLYYIFTNYRTRQKKQNIGQHKAKLVPQISLAQINLDIRQNKKNTKAHLEKKRTERTPRLPGARWLLPWNQDETFWVWSYV